eukprot:33871-Eustigmatos_ZCMA.PRE.1
MPAFCPGSATNPADDFFLSSPHFCMRGTSSYKARHDHVARRPHGRSLSNSYPHMGGPPRLHSVVTYAVL